MSPPQRLMHPQHECQHQEQLEMVRPLSRLAPVPSTPEGYILRQIREHEEESYNELFNLAFQDRGRFSEICSRTLPEGFFVVEHQSSGDLVASCLAFHGSSSPRHPQAGQLGWLVTDPRHTNKKLGTIVAAAATNRLTSEGFMRPFLGTEDFRSAAIAIYLNLGWVPYLYSKGMEQRWRAILTELRRDS